MKDFYNLDTLIDISNFPWQECWAGLAKSSKNPSIFYGHDAQESRRLELNDNNLYVELTKSQQVWYRSFSSGASLKGLDVYLTVPQSFQGAWWKLDDGTFWSKGENAKYFPSLFNWIQNLHIFDSTGRIIFFIQLQNANTPPHRDEDIKAIPKNYPTHREFIWLTSPSNPKTLLVNGVQTSNVVWFNSYEIHETLPSDKVKCSLRIDGKFNEQFKKKVLSL